MVQTVFGDAAVWTAHRLSVVDDDPIAGDRDEGRMAFGSSFGRRRHGVSRTGGGWSPITRSWPNMFGDIHRVGPAEAIHMAGFPSPFGSGGDELFDDYDDYVTEHLPRIDEFLDGHEVLTGEDHVSFHKLTKELFEERGVYDMTFNYNLARLNLDTRHPNAGYRYAEQADDPAILRAEFTPTTPFCPQTHTLTIGSFRAWNGLCDRHEYNLVRVRAATMHHQSAAINDQLAELEAEYEQTGSVPGSRIDEDSIGSNPMERAKRAEQPSRGPQRPF